MVSKQKRKDIKYKDPDAKDRIIANLKRGKKLELRKKTNKPRMPLITMRDLELIQGYLLGIHNIITEAKANKELSDESFKEIEKNIEAIKHRILKVVI